MADDLNRQCSDLDELVRFIEEHLEQHTALGRYDDHRLDSIAAALPTLKNITAGMERELSHDGDPGRLVPPHGIGP